MSETASSILPSGSILPFPYEPEPTHVMVTLGAARSYSIRQARDELVDVLMTRLGAVPYSDEWTPAAWGTNAYYTPLEVIVDNESILFVLKIWKLNAQGKIECVREEDGEEGNLNYCFEMHKLRGDTLVFCKLYRAFVIYCRMRLEILPQSEEHVNGWVIGNTCFGRSEELPDMLLTADECIGEHLSPVVAQLTSQWYQSQLEGIMCCAALSATPAVCIMARYAPLTDAVFELLKVPQRDIVRCAATTIVNMWVWQAGQEETIRHAHFLSCIDVLDRWIRERHGDPNWTHALRECRRARTVLGVLAHELHEPHSEPS